MALSDLDRMIVTHVIPKHDMGTGKIVGLATINGERRVVLLNFENEYRYIDGQMVVHPVSYGDLKDFSAVTTEDLSFIQENLNYPTPSSSLRKRNAPLRSAHPDAMRPARVNRVTSAILALFCGWFGLHLFLMNKTSMGILYAVLSFTGLSAIFGLVDFFKLLVMSDEEYAERYNYQGD